MEMHVLTSEKEIRRLLGTIVRESLTQFISDLQLAPVVQKEWLSNREAMDLLSLSKTTLQRYRSSGRLPYSKIGGKIFYHRADLESVLDEHRID